jgi:hypothetical protein
MSFFPTLAIGHGSVEIGTHNGFIVPADCWEQSIAGGATVIFRGPQ